MVGLTEANQEYGYSISQLSARNILHNSECMGFVQPDTEVKDQINVLFEMETPHVLPPAYYQKGLPLYQHYSCQDGIPSQFDAG